MRVHVRVFWVCYQGRLSCVSVCPSQPLVTVFEVVEICSWFHGIGGTVPVFQSFSHFLLLNQHNGALRKSWGREHSKQQRHDTPDDTDDTGSSVQRHQSRLRRRLDHVSLFSACDELLCWSCLSFECDRFADADTAFTPKI